MKNLLYSLLLIFSCNTQNKLNHKIIPKDIIDGKLEDQYLKTKWIIYCKNCDKKCIPSSFTEIKDTFDFAELDLKFSKVEYFNDTSEISFDFFYNDTLKCDINTVYHFDVTPSGIAFKKGSDSAIYFLTNTTIRRITYTDSSFRLVKPLQPEVINYIKTNKNKLNPWFREEAIRRKVIN
jgi:alanine-alpha-ketoisovalerate/valine-pyruvate aminotransferase